MQTALLLFAASLTAPASAGVISEWGGLISALMSGPGLPCGPVAAVVESVDPTWECTLTGPALTVTSPGACAAILEGSCVDVGDRDDDGDGYTLDGAGGGPGDCDDTDPSINPAAIEVCDGVDNDCSGAVDDNPSDGDSWYLDRDQDGYGDSAVVELACEQPLRFSALGGDCNDTAFQINPGMPERCDGLLDNDCDGAVDEAGAVDAATWYADGDGDDHGSALDAVTACEQPEGYGASAGDCDDSDATVYAGAPELCDGQRNDCDDGGWTDDSGLVSLLDIDGEWHDLSADFGAGTYAAPARVTVTDYGTLNLCAGTYYATLVSQVDLEVVAADGPGSVVLSGGNQTHAVEVAVGVDITLRDLTVTDGLNDYGGCMVFNGVGDVVLDGVEVTGCAATVAGGGIYAQNVDSLSLIDSSVTNNSAPDVGGVLYNGVDAVTMIDSDVSDNTAGAADGVAGGIYMIDALTATVSGLTANRNSAYYGGGLYIGASSGVSISSSDISDNTAGYYGGGIWFDSSAVSLDGVNIDDNTARYGAGFFIQGVSSAVEMSDCDMFSNDASSAGGAGYIYGGDLSVTSGDFAANSPYDIYAGGAYSYSYAESFTCDALGCY